MTKVPNYQGDPNDKTDDTPFDALKDKSLKAAGYALLAGDTALIISGIMGGRYKEAASGLIYAAGGLFCSKYANPDAEKQLRMMGMKLGEYLRKEGVEIPHEPTVEKLVKPGGLIENTEAFLYKYPSQMMNACFAVGGTQLMASGIQHGKHWDTMAGACVVSGGLGGILVSEQTPDPDKKPAHGPLAKAVSWFQEKPLRISGVLYGLNNPALIMSGIKEYKANPANKSYMFKFLTAASYMMGNTLLCMSSKENSGSQAQGDEALDKLATAAAQILAAQPREMQHSLMQHMAGFLASQPEATKKAPEIEKLMQEKMQSLAAPAQGSWLNKLGMAHAMQPAPGL